ncbi:MAG: hypothetical protein ACUVWO_14070 [Thermodesulfobacteriota bacterium]
MAFANKKAMGPYRSPMAFHPMMGMPLWVTRSKIKIKEIEAEELTHGLSLV